MRVVLEIQPRETSQQVALRAIQSTFDIDKFWGVQGHGVSIVVTRALVDSAGVDSGGSVTKNWLIFYVHIKSRTVSLFKSDLCF